MLSRRLTAPPAPVSLPPPPTLAGELTTAGVALGAWVGGRRGALYSTLDQARIAGLAMAHPEQAAATIAAAHRVCRHEFDLLGSGPYVPVDPDRPARGGYQPIDWYLDPITNLRFPRKVPHKTWNLMEMRPGLADVKLPWELGRCQHWLPLAQAFRLTGDPAFATEVLDQHDDFIEANPLGLGVNWTCTMDVAIRALNWAMALELLHATGKVDGARLARVYETLFDHGGFIEQNLENKYEVTSNHFLSNVVGLYGVAVVFADLPAGQRWLAACRAWLEQEMQVQVLDDGADYESSVPYHRLVTELFLSGWRLAQSTGAPLSVGYRDRLIQMLVFFGSVLRPDGRVPQVGDADDGRVHVFSEYGTWSPQDGRHLLAAGAAQFPDTGLTPPGYAWGQWEAAWWGLDDPPPALPSRDVARLFPEAGLAIVRDGRDYLAITNGRVGTNGFGNHKHNDLLSFEFHQHGVPLIVDPGSYVYTSDPDARNWFRSTLAHNTLTVDGTEQNEFKAEWLFRMFAKATPVHQHFEASAAVATYRGAHDGFARLASPVRHEREWRLDRATGRLTVSDDVKGQGRHRLQWRFTCGPGVDASLAAPGETLLSAGGRSWRLSADAALTTTIEQGWYSPSYGVRHACHVIAFECQADLSLQHRWDFTLEQRS